MVLLILVALRRALLVVAAARGERATRQPERISKKGPWPSVLVAVSCRDESPRVGGLLESLRELDLPADDVIVVLVNDGSADDTGAHLREAASAMPWPTQVIEFAKPVGKAAALNAALDAAADSKILVVYDADQQPRRDSIQRLLAPFADVKVGAVCGYRRPLNPRRTIVARYAALESFVHQWVVLAGKQRLGLNPPMMGGNCSYRRAALEQVGRFRSGAVSEDIEVSLALVVHGWRTVFAPEAVAESRIAETLGNYRQQRHRWTAGMYAAARVARGPESWFVVSGYLDRIIFVASAALIAWGTLSAWWILLYVVPPLSAIVLALNRAGEGRELAIYLASIPVMFVVDVAWTIAASIMWLLGGTGRGKVI